VLDFGWLGGGRLRLGVWVWKWVLRAESEGVWLPRIRRQMLWTDGRARIRLDYVRDGASSNQKAEGRRSRASNDGGRGDGFMSSAGQVEIGWWEESGGKRSDVTLLHANSAFPRILGGARGSCDSGLEVAVRC
jgi:hypothetical protein